MKKETFTIYQEEHDITFIMENTWAGDYELYSTECIGWYHGEPEPEDIEANSNRKMKALYDKRYHNPNNIVNIEENYCEKTDTTFVMEHITADGDPVSMECIGWYCGEPNADYTVINSDRVMLSELAG